jgi:hypothetical protein
MSVQEWSLTSVPRIVLSSEYDGAIIPLPEKKKDNAKTVSSKLKSDVWDMAPVKSKPKSSFKSCHDLVKRTG